MRNGNSGWATVKLVYLLALAVLLFMVRDPWSLAGLLGLQLLLWLHARLPLARLLRAGRRLWLFFLIIFIAYAFMSTGQANERWLEPGIDWLPAINLSGLAVAGLMCLRVMTLVLASTWLQLSSPAGTLVTGLRRLRIPESIAITVDASLALLGGQKQGGGQGKGRKGKTAGKTKHKAAVVWSDIRAGRADFLHEMISAALQRARTWLDERYPNLPPRRVHDLSVILAITLVIMGLKVLQVLPGVPIASGHKNLLIVPLLLLASHGTHMRFGGLTAGTAVGIVSFLLGYGKYGIIEIAHFAAPGLLADFLMPFARAQGRMVKLIQFAVIGAILGLGRFTANFLVIVMAGAPELAFLLFAPMLVSQLIFGTLSCFVSIVIVRRHLPGEVSGEPGRPPTDNDEDSRTRNPGKP